MNNLVEKIINQIKNSHQNTDFFQTATEREQNTAEIKKKIESYISKEAIEVQERLKEEFFGFGPLKKLFDNERVTEIILNNSTEIWYEINGELIKESDSFLSDYTFQQFLHRLFLDISKEPNLDLPFLDAFWNDYRLHIIYPYDPLTPDFKITFRSLKKRNWDFEILESLNWATPDQIDRIKKVFKEKATVLVIGQTGAGKTSVLSSLLNSIESRERLIILEDTYEIQLPNGPHTKLLTRLESETLSSISLRQLIKHALRMRPDRLVIGEVRGEEASDLLLALSTGHNGSIGTLHAGSAAEALQRLEMLVQMGQPHWSLQTIRRLIQNSVQYILMCEKSNGHRKFGGLYKISSLEEFGFTLDQEI